MSQFQDSSYYSRRNCQPVAAGEWQSDDGEYAFTRTARGWLVRRRDAAVMGTPSLIAITRTLAGAFTVASRHYMQPMRTRA